MPRDAVVCDRLDVGIRHIRERLRRGAGIGTGHVSNTIVDDVFLLVRWIVMRRRARSFGAASWSMAISTRTLPGLITLSISRVISFGARAPALNRTDQREIHVGKHFEDVSLVGIKRVGGVQVMSRNLIRSTSTSRIVTSAPSPVPIRAALTPGSATERRHGRAARQERHQAGPLFTVMLGRVKATD